MMECPNSPSLSVEIFDDFDEADMMSTTFCAQVSEAQFQNEISSETDKALGELCLFLGQNPEIYARVLRKRKQEEMENEGVFSFMKSKVKSVLHGERYHQSLVTLDDCIKKTNVLKAGMCKTFQLSEDLKGNTTRHSARLQARRQAQMANNKIFEAATDNAPVLQVAESKQIVANISDAAVLNPLKTQSSPQNVADTKPVTIDVERDSDANASFPSLSRPESAQSRDGPFLTPMVTEKQLRTHKRAASNSSIGSTSSLGSMSNVHSELLSSRPVTRLKSTQLPRSPGGTPVRGNCTDHLPSEPLQRALVKAMRNKFKNLKTPSPQSSTVSSNTSQVGNVSGQSFTFSP